MADIETRQKAAPCPRCGYDQRGVVATWVDSCPLEGTCPECGLEFNWPEVLHPEKFEPQWCVEFTPRKRNFPMACVRTLARSFIPWMFWSRLKMSHPIRPGRLAVYVVWLAVLLPLVLYVPMQAGVAIYVRYQVQQSLVQMQAQLPAIIRNAQVNLQQAQSNLTSTDDPSTLSYNQSMVAICQRQLAMLQVSQSMPPTVGITYFEAVSEAVLHPFGAASVGTVNRPGMVSMYPPPSMLWGMALQNFSGGWIGLTRSSTPVATLTLAGFLSGGIGLMALMPASLVLLPASRRRAKVRWRHIGRVLAYSLFIPVAVMVVAGLLFIAGVLGSDSALMFLPELARYAIPAMLILWWGTAIGRYMKIPHGMFTAFVLMAMCALLIVAGIWLAAPDILI